MRQQHETLATWRDRIYHEYRIPHFFAGLSEPRLSYIEQANPLLSRQIVEAVRTLPDRLRTNKNIFKQYVKRLEPEIPFASQASIPNMGNLLKTKEFRTLIREELGTYRAKSIFPAIFLHRLKKDLSGNAFEDSTSLSSNKSQFLYMLPKQLKTVLRVSRRKFVKPKLSKAKLALRSFIISKINTLLSDDANTLKIK